MQCASNIEFVRQEHSDKDLSDPFGVNICIFVRACVSGGGGLEILFFFLHFSFVLGEFCGPYLCHLF